MKYNKVGKHDVKLISLSVFLLFGCGTNGRLISKCCVYGRKIDRKRLNSNHHHHQMATDPVSYHSFPKRS